MPAQIARNARDSTEVSNRGCDSVIELTLMHGRPGTGRGGNDAADHVVEALLLDRERSGDGGAHRDLDRDDDCVAHRLDDPAESSERDVASAAVGIPRAIDGEQNLLQDRLHVGIPPGARLGSVLEALGGGVIAFAENNLDVELHATDRSTEVRVSRETP